MKKNQSKDDSLGDYLRFDDPASQPVSAPIGVGDDQVLLGSRQQGTLPPPGGEMIGKFQLNLRGFGFIVPDSPTEHGDLFVPAGYTGGALTGDHVRARVIHQGRSAGRGAWRRCCGAVTLHRAGGGDHPGGPTSGSPGTWSSGGSGGWSMSMGGSSTTLC